MLVVMKANASEEQVQAVCEKIESLDSAPTPCPARSAPPSALPATAAKSSPAPSTRSIGVQEVIRVSKPYKLVSREVEGREHGHPLPRFRRHHWRQEVAVIAGPCGIETREQAFAAAERVAKAGAQFFRGGAYKPRTSPYAFQGLGKMGLQDSWRKFASALAC